MATTDKGITVKFWGVRGSIPAPLTPKRVEEKIAHAIAKAWTTPIPPVGNAAEVQRWMQEHLSFAERSTFGGNTTCVEVRCGDQLLILDMGTGIRELGMALLPETFAQKGIEGTILQSHVHWDHIQGCPFFPHIYMPRSVFQNRFKFYGGKEWEKSLEEVLRGQMDAPVFPVNFRELERTALTMEFHSVWDGCKIELGEGEEKVTILCRKLHHPQETFGYRITYRGHSIAFCTDHEPYAAGSLPKGLLALADKADLFITDCQYSEHEYAGREGGVEKMGWGHSYPAYIAAVAAAANPKRIVTTHHDPASSDERIVTLARGVEDDSKIETIPAHEGLMIVAE